jgi:hypothetical protein
MAEGLILRSYKVRNFVLYGSNRKWRLVSTGCLFFNQEKNNPVFVYTKYKNEEMSRYKIIGRRRKEFYRYINR